MDSIILDNQIINALTLLEFRVIKANNFGYFDVNRKIQGYLSRILDVVYFDAKNNTIDLDLLKTNYPAIDLANYENRVAYQITSETNSQKIYSTLKKFVNLKDYKKGKLSEIRFLIIKKLEYTDTQLKNIKDRFEKLGLTFDENTLMTIPMLEKEISRISNRKKSLLISILNEELNNSDESLKFATKKDIEDLRELYGEHRFKGISRFEDAIDERQTQSLAKIFGIDNEEFEILEYTEQFIDRDNGINSVIYKFNPSKDTKDIISRIEGIRDNKVEIFDWDWPEDSGF